MVTRTDSNTDGDPLASLVRMVTTAANAVEAYALLLRESGEVLTSVDYGNAGGKRVEAHPLLKLWNDERDRLAKMSKLALDAGVNQRNLAIAERDARILADVVFRRTR